LKIVAKGLFAGQKWGFCGGEIAQVESEKGAGF
jgi:hypothetical protein